MNHIEADAKATQDIVNARKASIEKFGGTYDNIARELCDIGLSNIRNYFDVPEGGELQFKPFKKLTKRKSAAIKKIREKTIITESKDGEQIYKTSTVELELWDKHNALWHLIELRGDKPAEKHEQKGNVTVTVVDYSKAGENV